MNRRHFIAQSALSGLASALPAPSSVASNQAAGSNGSGDSTAEQKFHRDFVSYHADLEYFILGNGEIQAVLQSAATPGAGTHGGLFVMSPGHFSRKASTFLYHPERGAEQTRFFLTVEGRPQVPTYLASEVSWTYPQGEPTVRFAWAAGSVAVVEEYSTPAGAAVLVRTVRLHNRGDAAVTVQGRALLYPNLMLFDEYAVDRRRRILTARGYHTIQLTSPDATGVGDRHLEFDFGPVPAGGEKVATLLLSLGETIDGDSGAPLAARQKASANAWRGRAQLETDDTLLAHFFHVAKSGLRAAVAANGKMDGGIWQYNLEWVRDQSMVAVAAAQAGFFHASEADPAPGLLERMLSTCVDEQGGTVDSSRTRTPAMMELDQNGALLHALWTYWVWSGDDTIFRRHRGKIVALGAYLQQADFVDRDSGLLRNTREFWERDARYGVQEGFENSYQCWSIVGLNALADMVGRIDGDRSGEQRWRTIATQLQAAYLSHPRHSLVEQGVLIKRRLPDGTVQRKLEPPNRAGLPAGSPLASGQTAYCDPDTSCVLPIVHGLVDPRGEVARATLAAMESLWNQGWNGGGYGRYHVSAEPDSPGAWPLASLLVARANLEAGQYDRVGRCLRWLAAAPGGRGGAWWEFYGPRATPPLPPVGIVVWTWAEVIQLIIHHLLGVRPQPHELILAPHLLPGIDRLRATLPLRGTWLSLEVQRSAEEPRMFVDGQETRSADGVFHLPHRTTPRTVICQVR